MRGRSRYAGAMLLYGPQARPPDLTLAMQFLIDDLRFEGRKVTWVALKGSSLRLRVEGYELVLAHTDGALPQQAFNGVLRPAAGHWLTSLATEDRSATGANDDMTQDTGRDLARGRVLHSLRHHPCALSVLLRPRGTLPDPAPQGDSVEEALLSLVRECRALLEPVIEAAPPATIIWQPGAVAYTCEEFLASRAEALVRPGDAARPLQLVSDAERPRDRPALHAHFDAILSDESALPATRAPSSDERALASASPLPQSRMDRTARRSAGQLFGSARATRRPVALPRLHRQDARLAQAMRAAHLAPEAEAAARARQRRLNVARIANLTALALWYMLLLPPISGIL